MEQSQSDLVRKVNELIREVTEKKEERSKLGDQSAARNLALAITHLEDAAFRIGPPTWYQPNPGYSK